MQHNIDDLKATLLRTAHASLEVPLLLGYVNNNNKRPAKRASLEVQANYLRHNYGVKVSVASILGTILSLCDVVSLWTERPGGNNFAETTFGRFLIIFLGWAHVLMFIVVCYYLLRLYKIYWIKKRRRFFLDNMKLKWWNSTLPIQLLLEILIHSIFPFPMVESKSSYFPYLCMFPVLRFYTLVRLASSASDARAQKYQAAVGSYISLDGKTAIRIFFYGHAGRVLTFLSILTLFTGSLGVMLAEFHVPDSKFYGIGDCLWWTWITFSTVGYGDIVPSSNIGRFLGVLISGGGIVLVSIASSVLTNKLAPTKEELAIANFLTITRLTQQQKVCGAKVLQSWYKYAAYKRSMESDISSSSSNLNKTFYDYIGFQSSIDPKELKYRLYHHLKDFRVICTRLRDAKREAAKWNETHQGKSRKEEIKILKREVNELAQDVSKWRKEINEKLDRLLANP